VSFLNLPLPTFSEPLPPVPETDTGGICVTFDEKWRPYIVMVLMALAVPSAWESDADRCSGEATIMIEAFIVPGDCGD
jgi:hypothetical protein